MVVLIKLFGDLGEKYSGYRDTSGIPITLKIKGNKVETVFDVLKILGIQRNEISHIFVKGTYSGLGKVVNDGDRVGLFPKRMSLMFMEITKTKSIQLYISIFDDGREKKPSKLSLSLPEGSTLELVLDKCRISQREEKLKVLINGEMVHDVNHVVKNNDRIIVDYLSNS